MPHRVPRYVCDGSRFGLGGFVTYDADEAEAATEAGYCVTASLE